MSIKQLSFTTALLTGAILTSSLINCVYAKEIAIYRWVDKDNVVHFSQNLPQGEEYRELSTISSYKALSKAERKALAEQEKSEQEGAAIEKKQDDITAKNKATFEKNCKAARLNIKMLNSLDDIHINVEEDDGSVGSRPMTVAEKADQLTLSKKHEELYCTK